MTNVKDKIMSILEVEKDKSILSRGFFALSNLARGMGSTYFFDDNHGVVFLKRIYDRKIGLESKILVLIDDLLDPEMNDKGERGFRVLNLSRKEFIFWCLKIEASKIKSWEAQFAQLC